MRGRHGEPSLKTRISPRPTALATKSLSARSSRSRGLIPQAVAKRRQVVVKVPEASASIARSAATFDLA